MHEIAPQIGKISTKDMSYSYSSIICISKHKKRKYYPGIKKLKTYFNNLTKKLSGMKGQLLVLCKVQYFERYN